MSVPLGLMLALAVATPRARGAEPAKPAAESPFHPLTLAVDAAREGCDVALGHKASLPLPALRDGQAAFRVFFFPLLRGSGRTLALHPALLATVSPGGGQVACEEFPEVDAPFQETLGPAQGPGAGDRSFAAFQEMHAAFLSSVERAGASFARAESGQEARRAAREFAAAFRALAEPGLAAHYRAVSPDFWSWIDRLAGKP